MTSDPFFNVRHVAFVVKVKLNTVYTMHSKYLYLLIPSIAKDEVKSAVSFRVKLSIINILKCNIVIFLPTGTATQWKQNIPYVFL